MIATIFGHLILIIFTLLGLIILLSFYLFRPKSFKKTNSQVRTEIHFVNPKSDVPYAAFPLSLHQKVELEIEQFLSDGIDRHNYLPSLHRLLYPD